MTREEIKAEYERIGEGGPFRKKLNTIFKLATNIKIRVSTRTVTFWITDGDKPIFGTGIELYVPVDLFGLMTEPTISLSSMNFNPGIDPYFCQRIELQAKLIENWEAVLDLSRKECLRLQKLDRRYADLKSNNQSSDDQKQ